MTPEEASEIIAKFMGYKKLDPPTKTSRFNIRWVKGKKRMSYLDFHRSLDALVPVWEKLRKTNFFFRWDKDEWEFVLTEVSKLSDSDYEGIRELGTIQEAAAIATAKTIQELGK